MKKNTGFMYFFLFILIAICIDMASGQNEPAAASSSIADNKYSLSLLLSLENAGISGSLYLKGDYSDTLETIKPKIKLLPDRLSIVESALWGEHGFFRFTGLAPYTPESRKRELTYRRTILSIHQAAGFATLALFVPTLIYGQRNINMRNAAFEGRGVFDQNLANTHKILSRLTFTAYMTTAALAIFAPPPLIRRKEWSTISLHKTLALIHFTGMIATPILAIMAYNANTPKQERDLQKAHQVTAYVTAAAFTASMIVVTF